MISQWSHSRITGYEQCPQKTKFKIIDKLPDPPGPAADRGIFFHKVVEDYISGKLPELPRYRDGHPKLDSFKPLFDSLRMEQPLLEHQVGFTREWKETGFFAPDTWGRMVYDVIYYDEPSRTVFITDWKTGKPNGAHLGQLKLYAATGLLLFPEAREVKACDEYLDIGPRARMMLHMVRTQEVPVLEQWARLAAKLEAEVTFAPRPGPLCKWCTFRKSNAGPCEFG